MKLISAAKKSPKNLDESMIPAINIVFLLLIFFMIAGRLEVDLLQPPASLSQKQLEQQSLTIRVTRDGEYLVNDAAVAVANLPTQLQQLLEQGSEEIVAVNCFVDKDLPVSVLDPLLVAVRQLGIKQLTIATEMAN